MRKHSSRAYTLGAVGIAVLGATAGAQVSAQPLATPNWYLGGNIGRSKADFDPSSFVAVPPAAVTSIQQDDKATGYKVYGGYQLNPMFAVEAGFFHLGEFD